MARKTYNFVAGWKPAGIISSVLVAISIVLLFVPGPNYGIDFAGGTNIIARFTQEVDEGNVRASLAAVGFADASVVRFGAGEDHTQLLMQTQAVSALNDESRATILTAIQGAFGEEAAVEYDETSGDRVYVQIPQSAYDDRAAEAVGEDGTPLEGIAAYSRLETSFEEQIVESLTEAGFGSTAASRFGNPSARRFAVSVQTLQALVAEQFEADMPGIYLEIDRVETVGPRVGAQLRNDAVRAVLFALVGILLYIALRFDLRYAPGAVLALAHDVLITLGIFVLIREEISLPILAALLTIVGYSLNDTIVNYDRVRENLELVDSRKNLAQLVNRSLNECLSRTVLTSATTLIAVVCIFWLGGGLIRSFALAMIIGVIVGTYSSIFIASPAMVFTTKYLDAQAAVRKTNMAAARDAAS